MEAFWNERYAKKEYAYGTKPNEFFKEAFDKLHLKGKMLFPAEGEGRNAVFAAENACDVFAFDSSLEARNKALRLADGKGVTFQYQVGRMGSLNYSENSFDAIVLIFAHFPPATRNNYHEEFIRLLKPGAYLILEAFHKDHIFYNSSNPEVGGPKDRDLLYSEEELEEDFSILDTIQLDKKIVELNEGIYHKGVAAVIRYIGRKK